MPKYVIDFLGLKRPNRPIVLQKSPIAGIRINIMNLHPRRPRERQVLISRRTKPCRMLPSVQLPGAALNAFTRNLK